MLNILCHKVYRALPVFRIVESTFFRSQRFSKFVPRRWLKEGRGDVTEIYGLFLMKLLLEVSGGVYFFFTSVCTLREQMTSFQIEELE